MRLSKVFHDKGFLIQKNFVNVKGLTEYFFKNENKGTVDEQSPNSLSFYRIKKIDDLQKQLLPKLEKLLDLKLFKTYNYSRIYQKDAILKMHKDRAACEISLTLNIGYDKKPWDIWITDYEENPHKAILNPGDALVYHGCDLWHWRGKFKGKWQIQSFLHYVDAEGPYKAHKNDMINKRNKNG
jgi:hypothetical protein